ncbi:glyoxylase-like metal-dependent hydrolase (beta-lactamase superfamily II) [Novosphingobium chloroacetimidivorans]|uniref:Glyoxylase-like metal-dependent hydrolase (Beta-lactamase superfamily II) n=1 Tax=Novosphingobium chloroacetimidivorans TaxID=1428314 RepID=A0A7W7NY69_9SPHN|nr:MBL fold metallo-hydrolase [Novosphingobium chloroacetimidivorans]MBB4860164.1 glyoxylase-like metal-dependent hydrolase (beta-lactamase superfamily II) [Novosphingobium chloroacetimidivorans]
MASDPKLANLVRSGDAQTDAIAITPFVFQANDISNAYLVTTSAGDVMVNTGFMDNAERTKALLAPHRTGPLAFIVLTQSHADHFGGVPEFVEEGTQVIGGPGFVEANADMLGLQSYFGPRSGKLWGSTLKRGATPKPAPMITPDILVDRKLTLELGERTFEIIHTPEGETIDGLTVWLPRERIAFTGNLFGPVWLSMPFLCTLRGDKPRSVRQYLTSLEKVRDLGAEIVVTGHGDAIRGAERIRADLDKMHAAVSYVRDYTLDGMKAGKTVHQLMREFAWPEDLEIGEFHGKASWAVKTIWEEYSGWFHYEDGTTELYGVPRSSVDADLVELAGGADNLAERAKAKLDAGQPLEALHLVAIALGAEPGNQASLRVKKAASEALLAASGGSNLSETMWLRSEIAEVEAKLAD